MMDTDDKPPESGDEIEPVSLRELEMILKPGKPPPPIKKPDAPSPPRPPRPPAKNASRTQGDLGVGDLAAFAVLSGSTPPPPAAKPAGRAAMSSSTDEAGRPRPPRPLPKPPVGAKKDPAAGERAMAPDSALEDLRALARESQRPKSASVDFDDLLSMRDDVSARALSSPAIPLDLTLLTSSEPTATSADEGWDDPPRPVKVAAVAAAPGAAGADAAGDAQDVEPPPSVPPSSRGPSSRRAIGREARTASTRPPKSQRGARSASKAPPAKKPADDRVAVAAPVAAAKTARTSSVAPPQRDSTSVSPQSMPPAFAKSRSKLPILIGAGAVALAAIIWFATRGGDEPAPEAKNSAAAPDRTNAPTRPAQPDPTSASNPAPSPTGTDAVATRSGDPVPVTPGPNTTGTRPSDPVGTSPNTTTTTTATATTTTTTTTAPTTAPSTTAATEPSGEFNAGAASAALSGRAGAAAGCKQPGDPSGVATVTVTFAPSGRVTQANVSGPPFAGTKTGGCIAGAMRGATVPPFSGSAKTVSKTVQIP